MRLRARAMTAGETTGLRLTLGALLALGPACQGEGDGGTQQGLPPEHGGTGSTTGDGGGAGTGWTGTGSSGTGGGPAAGDDESPAHLLTLVQEGSWTLSPPAPPYESLSGTLTVTELLDGDETLPACTATFALTGVALPPEDGEPCADCEASFEVLHYLSQDGGSVQGVDSGAATEVPGLASCLAPDLPAHEEVWVLGLADDRIERRLGLSGWVDWYEAEQVGATVDFSWTATVGLEGDEEETE